MNWKEYEEAVYFECQRVYGRDNTFLNVSVKGVISQTTRQIDILVKNKTDSRLEQIAFEVKYYSRKIDIKTVESFISMLEDTGIDKGVLVTEKGYSTSAIKRAHNGNRSIEVDILSLGEWQKTHTPFAIPHAGGEMPYLFDPLSDGSLMLMAAVL